MAPNLEEYLREINFDRRHVSAALDKMPRLIEIMQGVGPARGLRMFVEYFGFMPGVESGMKNSPKQNLMKTAEDYIALKLRWGDPDFSTAAEHIGVKLYNLGYKLGKVFERDKSDSKLFPSAVSEVVKYIYDYVRMSAFEEPKPAYSAPPSTARME